MLKVEVVLGEGETLEKAVDEDIASFEKFMMHRVDDSGPLSRPEKAIIKTYLWFKTHPEEGTDGTTTDD